MNIEEYNRITRKLTISTKNIFRTKIPKNTGELYSSLSYKTKKRDGFIYRVNFPFVKYGIFLVKGVGRGYSTKTGKLRKKQDWIEESLNDLFNQIKENYKKLKLQELSDVFKMLDIDGK